ncbi:hypothetical protein MOJ79_14765 [Calidifontimicrobium sp. SYSU G02091]|uniref:hypothetical protein n=1 Tax=Calidifontimicrobium sp. SYSU G02091 TaxID=2926421 RepID=UPI001F53CD39|nr:hypothetical protein [Calidifontimicrobium sp. SYSU G02091]MCI1193103.1 hypothetical protein [Calidifontimicrobium sp. SYSU G02091]
MSPPDPTRPAGLRSPLHAVGHVVLVVLGWAGFVWLWSLVLVRPWESADLRGLIVGTLVVAPTLTVAWIVHNVGIYRRRGPRRSVPAVTWRYERDYNEREIVADFVALRDARAVVIDVDGRCKRFVAVDESPRRDREPADA